MVGRMKFALASLSRSALSAVDAVRVWSCNRMSITGYASACAELQHSYHYRMAVLGFPFTQKARMAWTIAQFMKSSVLEFRAAAESAFIAAHICRRCLTRPQNQVTSRRMPHPSLRSLHWLRTMAILTTMCPVVPLGVPPMSQSLPTTRVSAQPYVHANCQSGQTWWKKTSRVAFTADVTSRCDQ